MRSDQLEPVPESDGNPSVSRRGRVIAARLLALLALVFAVLALTPRSSTMTIADGSRRGAPSPTPPPGAAEALFACSDTMIALRTPDEVLVNAAGVGRSIPDDDRSKPPPHAASEISLLIEKGWGFGGYRYWYRFSDGSLTPLTPSNKWPSCSVEVL